MAMFAAVAILAVFASGPGFADTRSELDSAKGRLDRLLDRIEGERAAIDELQAQANELALQISTVESAIAQTQAQIGTTQQQIRSATEELNETQAQLDERARIAYENGVGSNLEFLLGSTSLTDLSDRLEIVNSAAASDQELIDKVEAQKRALETKRRELQALFDEQHAQERNLEAQQDALNGKLGAAQAQLDRLSEDKAKAAEEVAKLEDKLEAEQRARWAALIPPAGGGGGGGGGGGPSVGGVFQVCPVDAPHAYSDDFGAPRYGGGFHPHAGNDIFAPMGTPVRAPFAGTATDSSNGLGGLSVQVSGPAGYVYNAHLSRVGQLGAVSAGTIVGYVGNTGDAQGGATHNHFEWHPYSIPANLHSSPYGLSQVGSAIDPYPYLNSVC